jgi:hypothetical protein
VKYSYSGPGSYSFSCGEITHEQNCCLTYGLLPIGRYLTSKHTLVLIQYLCTWSKISYLILFLKCVFVHPFNLRPVQHSHNCYPKLKSALPQKLK